MTRPSTDLHPPLQGPLARLDLALFRWHRMAIKGEMVVKLMAELGIDLEPAQFRALSVLGKLPEAGGEPTVGRLAEELGLDPSRASRIASELIARGHVARQAAQDDGRKTLLVLTKAGRRDLERFGALRRAKQAAILADWPEEDVAAFARLLERYTDGVGQVVRGEV